MKKILTLKEISDIKFIVANSSEQAMKSMVFFIYVTYILNICYIYNV